MNTLTKIAMTLALAATFTAALPREAHARRRIPIIYQSGQDAFVAGDGSLPDEFADVEALDGYQAGYMCDVFGIMYAYFTIDDCKAVAFKDDSFVDDADLVQAIAAAHPEDTMQVGWWAKHGRYPLGLLIVGLIGFGIWAKLAGDD